ncbi:MAG: glycine dehydrogenase (aminomethyl-transferring), partial [Rhodoferax sp.]
MSKPHMPSLTDLENPAEFVARHIGISAVDEALMLQALNAPSRQALIDDIVPRAIAHRSAMAIAPAISEAAALAELKGIAAKNQVFKSYIGQGYYASHTPGVILRNILENPAWYTAYTPYQAEISQGRMEALVNFQTMVTDLTALPMANASMLDEATAAAEAMTLALRAGKSKSNVFFVDKEVLPQTLEVIQTRAAPLGIRVKVCSGDEALSQDSFAVLLQYPGVSGVVRDDRAWIKAYKASGGIVIMAADLLALTLLMPPGELGADIA